MLDRRSFLGGAAALAASAALGLPGIARAATPRAYVHFGVNVHDWTHPSESADTVLRLASLFSKYKVHGDFYVTAWMVDAYAAQRPEVLPTLKQQGHTLSYHVRAPHILYPGFGSLAKLDDATLKQTLLDYETYKLDMKTGQLDRSAPGGYLRVKDAWGSPPVTATAPTYAPRVKKAAFSLYKTMGARVAVLDHEEATAVENPYTYIGGLLARPSDIGLTTWGPNKSGTEGGVSWWNGVCGIGGSPADYEPVTQLKKRLSEWRAERPAFVTALSHENNFARFGPEGFALVYYADKEKKQPLSPPFDLNARDVSTVRSKGDVEKIYGALERLVAYVSSELAVATSADIARMAGA